MNREYENSSPPTERQNFGVLFLQVWGWVEQEMPAVRQACLDGGGLRAFALGPSVQPAAS